MLREPDCHSRKQSFTVHDDGLDEPGEGAGLGGQVVAGDLRHVRLDQLVQLRPEVRGLLVGGAHQGQALGDGAGGIRVIEYLRLVKHPGDNGIHEGHPGGSARKNDAGDVQLLPAHFPHAPGQEFLELLNPAPEAHILPNPIGHPGVPGQHVPQGHALGQGVDIVPVDPHGREGGNHDLALAGVLAADVLLGLAAAERRGLEHGGVGRDQLLIRLPASGLFRRRSGYHARIRQSTSRAPRQLLPLLYWSLRASADRAVRSMVEEPMSMSSALWFFGIVLDIQEGGAGLGGHHQGGGHILEAALADGRPAQDAGIDRGVELVPPGRMTHAEDDLAAAHGGAGDHLAELFVREQGSVKDCTASAKAMSFSVYNSG